MHNRAAAAQVGDILPGAVGRDISQGTGSAREAHPLYTRPPFTLLTVCTQGGHRHSVEY